ncbi:hypothetical protein ACQCR9_26505, partial [Ralstonia pseudosolanacearum]
QGMPSPAAAALIAGFVWLAIDNKLPDMDDRVNRLAELNVLEQVRWLRESSIVREAEPAPRVHGWIFGLADGRIRVLGSGEPGEAPPVRGDILEPAEAEA